MSLSVVVPSVDGATPKGLAEDPGVEIVFVAGVRPVSAARNEGLRRATGEWLAWVDADDEVGAAWKDTILEAIRTADADSVDVICFGADIYRTDGRVFETRYSLDASIIPAVRYLRDILRDMGGSTWLWNKVFRRSLFDGLWFEGVTQEDFRMMPRVLTRARNVRSIPDVLYRYTRPVGSLTHCGGGLANARGILAATRDGLCDVWCRDLVLGAWKEGCALRAADWLWHCGKNAEMRRFLRRNLWRILLDMRQTVRYKVKGILAYVASRQYGK